MARKQLKDRRIAAVRKARKECAAFIAECVFFGPHEADSRIVVLENEASGRQAIKEWIAMHAGESATDDAIARILAEGGFYRPGFKLKLEPTERYALLYDVTLDGAAA
jgi:hypothetical protein